MMVPAPPGAAFEVIESQFILQFPVAVFDPPAALRCLDEFPKAGCSRQIAEEVLNQAAFTKTKKPEEARFGKADAPEMLDIRGSHALLFDQDGELTLFWIESGIGYTAAARIPQKDLFRLVEDLL